MGDLQPNSPDKYIAGHDPDELYGAIDAGNLEQVQGQIAHLQMEERKCRLLKEARTGELPLHCAARLGHSAILKHLISSVPDHHQRELTNHVSREKRRSCLHFAAAYGHRDVVEWLVESCKANVSQEDLKKNTPLHLAVSAGHKCVVRYLVPGPASLESLNQKNMMPISYCKDQPMFEALLLASFDSAAAGPSAVIVQPGTSHVDARGRTILHYAAQFAKDSDAILKLITNNTDHLHQVDSQQDTFLHVAAKCGNIHVLHALKKLGANHVSVTHLFEVGASDLLRTSPGMYALLRNRKDFFDELITFGHLNITLGDIIKGLIAELIDDPGINKRLGLFASTLPTYLALYAKKECIFNFLLETSTLTLSQWDDEYKRTCLHWAIVDERTDIIRMLCKNAHIQPGLQDRDGKSVMHLAFDKKNQMMMEILRSNRGLKEHEEKLFRDRDVYVQALNAILVCAALIASVTFAGWLQVPSGARFRSLSMRIFWATNSISFFSAVATMYVTTTALLPTPNKYVGGIVNELRLAMAVDGGFFAFSLAAVTVAFAAAGCEALLQSHDNIYLTISRFTTSGGLFFCSIMYIAFLSHLYMHILSKRSMFALVLTNLPCAEGLLPATMRKKRERIGHESRFGYSSKPVHELQRSLKRNLVEDHPAMSRQLALGSHATWEKNLIAIADMKKQLESLDIPSRDKFIDMIYAQKENEYIANSNRFCRKESTEVAIQVALDELPSL